MAKTGEIVTGFCETLVTVEIRLTLRLLQDHVTVQK